eukprot:TRINITY_DN20152_c0_g1_i1.p1 TRINITY_DN20152_c0_g1~~TRINITY_DN20152_c0_g1_i1.p1  ORF type:complete len:568 (-),score=88.16 TRINITY_DN20152_c0_g1_i1:189-1892(-)
MADVVQMAADQAKTHGFAFDFKLDNCSRAVFEQALEASWKAVGAEEELRAWRRAPSPRRSASTADLENRLADRKEFEEKHGFKEFGENDVEILGPGGLLLARGYRACLYGDHGAYLELNKDNVHWPSFTSHVLKGPGRHYHAHYTDDGSVDVYDQFNTVVDEPNPPPGKRATHNNRPEGYADYRSGRLYLCMDHVVEKRPARVPSSQRIRKMPKVELHAHLSGSVTQAKLIDMLEKLGTGETFTPFDCKADVSKALPKCFDYFTKVAKVITNPDGLKDSTLHVFDTFAAENCLYLELRTSPKKFKFVGPDGNEQETSKLHYLQTIKAAIDEFSSYAQERFGFVMDIRILLSINRGIVTSKESALEQIDDILALSDQYPDLVVGVDVCGDPLKATAVPYLIPALLDRREAFKKLPITYHTAETRDDEESELVLRSMAALNIRRLGHLCCFPDACRLKVLEGGIHKDGAPVGIEMCPTSNWITNEMGSLDEHHIMDWLHQSEHVCVSVNTDDRGLFSCDLTSELHDIANAKRLTFEELVEMQRQAIRSSFHPDKAKLLAKLDSWLKVLC